jgi:hypothetical protein
LTGAARVATIVAGRELEAERMQTVAFCATEYAGAAGSPRLAAR